MSSKYVVKCTCGAISGCLPPGVRPPGMPYTVTLAEIERSNTCCQCSRTLDPRRGYFVTRKEQVDRPENLLSVAGASNAVS